MAVSVICFDLDGTLIDSAPDLTAAVNHVMASLKLAPISPESVRHMIGEGAKKLTERALKANHVIFTDAELEQHTTAMIAHYMAHLTDKTVLMKGAEEAVKSLAKSYRLAIVTNKPYKPTCAILDHYGLTSYFEWIVCGDHRIERKPAPDMLNFIREKAGVEASQVAMIGDSSNDIDAACNADAISIAVRGGYTSIPCEAMNANHVIDNLEEINSIL